MKMSSSHSYSKASTILLVVGLVTCLHTATSTANFYNDVSITWGDGRGKVLNGGQDLALSLDQVSGSGFQSNNAYLFGRFDMQIKLVPGNSAGTVATFYLSSQGPTHDEIDFEFLGNSSGDPYTLHTNVYAHGVGGKEEQFRLWFDPTIAFHTYSIVWNSQLIMWLVDNVPIRVFHNNEAAGVPFPTSQPMRMYASFWDADNWATQGGRVKTDWTKAPFTVTYRNFNANGCVQSSTGSSCNSKSLQSASSLGNQAWQIQQLDAAQKNRLKWVARNQMIYNYCTDFQRFPQGLPAECKLNQ